MRYAWGALIGRRAAGSMRTAEVRRQSDAATPAGSGRWPASMVSSTPAAAPSAAASVPSLAAPCGSRRRGGSFGERGPRRLQQPVSANDPNAIYGAINQARQGGAKVVTFDSDTNKDCRDPFVKVTAGTGVYAAHVARDGAEHPYAAA